MDRVRKRRAGVSPAPPFPGVWLALVPSTSWARETPVLLGSEASTTFASSASNTGALSPMGEAVTIFPPIVARFRIWREPKTRNIRPSAGNSSAIFSSISVSVTAAPICHSVSVEVIALSSGTASTEINVGNFLNRFVMSSPNSVAPAISRPSGNCSINCSSPASDAGRKNFSP